MQGVYVAADLLPEFEQDHALVSGGIYVVARKEAQGELNVSEDRAKYDQDNDAWHFSDGRVVQRHEADLWISAYNWAEACERALLRTLEREQKYSAWLGRCKQLRLIRHRSRYAGTWFGPRAIEASFFTAIAIAIAFKITDGISTVGLLAGLLVWLAYYRFSKTPKTHAELLDFLLAAYEPASVNHYRELQENVRKYGFSVALLEDWLEREYEALSYAKPASPAQASSKFINKRL